MRRMLCQTHEPYTDSHPRSNDSVTNKPKMYINEGKKRDGGIEGRKCDLQLLSISKLIFKWHVSQKRNFQSQK